MARPEVADKRTTQKADPPKYTRRPVIADPSSLAMSIREFCRLHGISEDQFYKMKREAEKTARPHIVSQVREEVKRGGRK